MGRVPTPTSVLKTRGSWRAKARSGEPASLPQKVPDCPPWLTKGAKAIWAWLGPQINVMRTTTEVDAGEMEKYCVYKDRWLKALKKIDTFEVGTIERRRAAIEATEYCNLWTRAAINLGLTPSHRARVKEIGAVGGGSEKAKSKSRFFPAGPPLRITPAGETGKPA